MAKRLNQLYKHQFLHLLKSDVEYFNEIFEQYRELIGTMIFEANYDFIENDK